MRFITPARIDTSSMLTGSSAMMFFGLSMISCSFFFFCQAEDGIRGLYVTGVQTCALPISDRHADKDVGAARGCGSRDAFQIAGIDGIQKTRDRRLGEDDQSTLARFDHPLVEGHGGRVAVRLELEVLRNVPLEQRHP